MIDKSLQILFEDNHLIAVNKKPSELVQSDKTGDPTLGDSLKQYIKEKYQKPGDVYLGVIHRLDRPTSGIVLFAKTSKALSRMNAQLRNRETNKKYWAVCRQAPRNESGTLQNFLYKDSEKNKSFVSKTPIEGKTKEALLTYKLISEQKGYFLLEIALITGRHHQIRAQLSNAGCPIIGDNKYGYPRQNRDYSIHLHARSLSFTHPVGGGGLIHITAKPPADIIWDLFSHIPDNE